MVRLTKAKYTQKSTLELESVSFQSGLSFIPPPVFLNAIQSRPSDL